MRSSWCVISAVVGGLAIASLHAFGCSPKTDPGPAGGPASGSADVHCSVPSAIVQETSASACHPDAGPEDATPPEAGNDYGPTLYGVEGDDDDCKYHVKYSVTPVRENVDVTFTLAVTRKSDGQPAAGADPYIEGYLNETHSIPNADTHTNEVSPGNYTIGPIHFDAPGAWTIRFHMYGDCSDFTDDSPHGHAAFFVDVP